jgi:molybdopterin converting factor subunit 1
MGNPSGDDRVRIDVLYFASAREAAGVAEESVEVPEGTTVGGLERLLCDRHPALRDRWPSLRFAVDERFEPEETALFPGARVALLPPVSGG